MNRRTLLRRTAAAGVAFPLAGCLRTGDDEAGLTVVDTNYEESEDGNVAIAVTVSNPSDRDAAGTLYVTITVDGESYARERRVTPGANETTTVLVEFDVQYNGTSSISWNTDLVED